MPILPIKPLSNVSTSLISKKKSLLISQFGANGGLFKFSVIQTFTADYDFISMLILLLEACIWRTID